MIELTHEPIDTAATVLAQRAVAAGRRGGAVSGHHPRVHRRPPHRRRSTTSAIRKWPNKKLAELEAEARRRWPLIECAIVHRLGIWRFGEASVAVAVSTPHRGAAFEAGQWLIDTLKEVVPIWKQENWADGTTEWVHPGVNCRA